MNNAARRAAGMVSSFCAGALVCFLWDPDQGKKRRSWIRSKSWHWYREGRASLKNDAGQCDIPPLKHPKQIAAGGAHTCALSAEGVTCWGANGNGQVQVPVLKNPGMITAGGNFNCALTSSGVRCWGSGSDGQLRIPPLKSPSQIDAGAGHVCALDEGQVTCWGRNNHGQSKAPALNHPRWVEAGWSHSCALVAPDKDIQCWGKIPESIQP